MSSVLLSKLQSQVLSLVLGLQRSCHSTASQHGTTSLKPSHVSETQVSLRREVAASSLLVETLLWLFNVYQTATACKALPPMVSAANGCDIKSSRDLDTKGLDTPASGVPLSPLPFPRF